MMLESWNSVADWLGQNEWFIWLGFGLSLTTLLATIVIVPWLIVRIPPDYFVHHRPPITLWEKTHPALRVAALIIKNAFGLVLLLAGFVMLFVPGQGVITMLIGLGLFDLPGKRVLECWIVGRPAVFAALNKLRTRYNQPLLEYPCGD